MTIVQLDSLDTFVRDSLSIVRKGVAEARNRNQANPDLGMFVDLPEKIDFEINVVSGYQALSRISSILGSSGENENTSTWDMVQEKELSFSRTGLGASEDESGRENDELDEAEGRTSDQTVTGTDTDTSGKTSTETSTRNTTDTELERSGSRGGSGEESTSKGQTQSGSKQKGDAGQQSESKGADTQQEVTKGKGDKTTADGRIEKSKSGSKTSTREDNQRWARAFNKKTGNWGGQSFSAITIPHTLKCS